jgi:hypothetical protein
MTGPATFTPPLPQLAELWPAIVARLDTPQLRALLLTTGGPGTPSGVYLEGDDPPPDGLNDTPWGRLAVVPVVRAYGMAAALGESRPVAFLVRAEFNNLDDPGYSVDVSLDAAHRLAYQRLQGWTPAAASGEPFRHLRPFTPVGLAEYPQARALYDDPRALYFTSAQYRLSVYL